MPKSPTPKLCAYLLASSMLAFSAGAALAENNNPTRVRIDFDPATGQPICTVVPSEAAAMGVIRIPCPPAVLARTNTSSGSSGTESDDQGGSSGNSGSGNSGTTSTGGTTTGTSDRNGTSGTSGSGSSGTTSTGGTTAGIGDSSGTTGNSGSGSGTEDSHGGNTSDNEGRGHGPVSLAGALNGGANAASVLRFANFGNSAGIGRVAIVNPADGNTVATWATPELPPHASLEISLSAITAAATLAPTATTVPAVVDLQISASYRGTVQHLIGNAADGSLTDASSCGRDVTAPRERLGYVPADTATAQSWVRLVNTNTAAATAAVVVRNAATGASAGTWTSPMVAGGGSVTVPVATIRTEAAVDPTVSAVVIDTDHLAEGLRLELVVTSSQSGAVADQTIACGL